jgi:hypothetical protein
MKKLTLLLLLFCIIILNSCNWFSEKTKETVNKSGEIVSKTGTEFIDGVSKGIEKAYENEIILSENLKKLGIKTGKISISSSEGNSDDILTTYLIFETDFNKVIEVKIYDNKNEEYGRISQNIKGKKGEAKYFDFQFDKRTNIDGKGKITFE